MTVSPCWSFPSIAPRKSGRLKREGKGDKTRYDAASAVQLTTGTSDGRAEIVSLNDGRIVYVARTGEQVDLWRMSNKGTQQQQLTFTPPFLEEVSAPSDGSFFVFTSNHAGYSHLFRLNHDGTNLRQLTSGESHEIDSDCSPDGLWIVYASQSSPPGTPQWSGVLASVGCLMQKR